MRRAFILGTVGVLAAACVPRGDPPTGQQVLADRLSLPLAILPSNGDGTTRVLFVRPGQAEGSMDLYVLSVDAAGGPPVERLLAASASGNSYGGCGYASAACFETDARGRLLVFSGYDPAARGGDLRRIDPVTGDQIDLGAATDYVLSPDGQRLFTYPSDSDAPLMLYESDDRAVPVPDTSRGAEFAGDTLYYVTNAKAAMRLGPGGTPELLATGVDSMSPQLFDGGVVAVLGRPTANTFMDSYSILDTATLQETPLAAQTNALDFSPDGRWVVTTDYVAETITFTDWRTGAHDLFQLPPSREGFRYDWRPGHDELWLPNVQDGPPITWIKKPGVDPVEVPGLAGGLGGAMFTPDGVYWFSQASATNDQPTLVGPADDPTGPRVVVMQANMAASGFWQLANGRLAVAASHDTPELNDVYVVDPVTGDTRVMGEQGQVLAVGRTRLLVNQHVVHGGGDLTVFDTATGRPTVIAGEFAMTAVVEPHDADGMAPGSAVAFRFQARFPSPYDGIWLTTVP